MKLSVVVAAFNADQTLPTTLNSLIAAREASQNQKLIHFIVIDDGSAVDLRESLSSYHLVPQLTIVRLQNNSGLWHARNIGVSTCDSDYVTFVDADDIVRKGFFNELYPLLRCRPDAIATRYSDWLEETNSHRPDPRRFPSAHFQEYLILAQCFMPSFSTISRIAFDDVGGYRPSVTEDWDFWIRFFRAGYRSVRMETDQYLYRIHPLSLSRRPDMPFRDLATVQIAIRENQKVKLRPILALSFLERLILIKTQKFSRRAGVCRKYFPLFLGAGVHAIRQVNRVMTLVIAFSFSRNIKK
jgi:glycosyltransferase involved in cell wall biosynthesis